MDRYKYFMRFLLEGKIIPSLKALRVRHSSLLHEPWRSCNRHITFCAFHHHTPHRHTHTRQQENLSGRPSLITAPTTTQHKILAFLQTLSSNKVYNKKTLMAKLYAHPHQGVSLTSLSALPPVSHKTTRVSPFLQQNATQVLAGGDEAVGQPANARAARTAVEQTYPRQPKVIVHTTRGLVGAEHCTGLPSFASSALWSERKPTWLLVLS